MTSPTMPTASAATEAALSAAVFIIVPRGVFRAAISVRESSFAIIPRPCIVWRHARLGPVPKAPAAFELYFI